MVISWPGQGVAVGFAITGYLGWVMYDTMGKHVGLSQSKQGIYVSYSHIMIFTRYKNLCCLTIRVFYCSLMR